ncbi:sensor histidine kinase [Curtobacterium sp. VKM Ac-2922]|uniref:sensor histidine kinase n=1 Tax=Curtobacterium sp. VKM Ac-2922 TaxID=2929475 RepID=UPI001FB3C643|nr:ATP-binding protein [Curtobacterium sp. VKM Ac-2922]MCJ1713391.1 hypothetical protein [Curtobacterium sp. VKM Ac-2922]
MTSEVAPFGSDPARGVRATISERSVERVLSIMLAVGGVCLGLVNAAQVLDQLPHLDPFWGPVAVGVFGAALLFVGASAFAPQLAQPAQIVCALLFVVALFTWPATVVDPLDPGKAPWPWWFCNVGTIAAAIGMAPWRATVYNVVVPAGYVVIRMLPAGGGLGFTRALLDGVYVAILGGAGLVIIVVLRRAAAAVDTAQATAVRRYADAIRAHATEVERVQVDSIVHDSVLTTLLSSARADTPDGMQLSARMARNAIDHLGAAAADAPGDVPPVTLVELRQRIAAGVAALAAPVRVTAAPAGAAATSLPASVADAIASAALQAAVNSVQHAGDCVDRWVAVRHVDGDTVRVEVGDDGAGFDVGSIPPERLGVRRSIIERVATAGGVAHIDSAPGAGTRIVLTWTGTQRHDDDEELRG